MGWRNEKCSKIRPGIKPSMLGRAARLGGANRARAADWAARPNRAEPERQGHATEQAEPSMQATEPSPSGPSARFAQFDYSPEQNKKFNFKVNYTNCLTNHSHHIVSSLPYPMT